MSAAGATARPSQALRQRPQRPSLARTTKPSALDNGVANKQDPKRYNQGMREILHKFNGSRPSLRVYLYANHFRINDSQESFQYASPMNELLKHIRDKTVPHNMLDEFYAAGVPFYDNCLIVEVHDFRSGGIKPQDNANNTTDGNKSSPFSIHNYNNFITPSPYVPFLVKSAPKPPPQLDGSGKPAPAAEGAKEDKETDKENMPAPGQPASQKQPTKAKISTIVLFPTPQSHNTDVQLLATTPVPDMQTYRRNQAAGRTASTPTMAHPPTPLTAVPPTPNLPSGRSPKRQKMVVDETNIHEFDSELLIQTCPKLYLEPTKNLGESLALMDAMTHVNNQNPAPARKSRKRTTAELAADEAEAADTQRFMLAGDEWQATKTAPAAAGEESQTSMRGGANFQTFSRFKTLESIKMHHEETERRKKEEEARQAQAKRQAQAEAEAQKRREDVARQAEQNQAMQNQAMMQHRQEQLLRQQQQQQLQQQEALRAASQAQQMANSQPTHVSQTPQSATQPQFSSPVVRQQTPMVSASSPHVTAHPIGGTPMVATSSNHGAGSPPRPPSVVSHQPATMARTVSQQQNQPMSRTGTPQVIQGTPVMNSTMPARNMASTPQPRVNQGSPTMSMQGGTPIMVQTPQPGQNMSQEQMHQMMQRQQAIRMRHAAQQNMQGSPGQNVTPETLALTKAKAHISQNGVPQGQNLAVYQQHLARQFFSQHQQQQAQMQNMSPQNAGQGMPNMGMNNPAQRVNVNSMSAAQLRNQYQQRKAHLMQQYGNNIPHDFMQQMRQLEIAVQQATQREAAQHGNQMGAGMNQQGIQGMNMGGPQNPQNTVQMQQQYQQVLQQRQRQQQRMVMRQQQGMGGQMQQNMMNNMGIMNGGNMAGMNMNMQNMQGMNMGNMGNMMGGMQMNSGMTQQQMQQMLMMRQAQQAQQMRAGQQGRPQGDGGLEWSGV